MQRRIASVGEVIENNGRPVGTRTPDLYRVKVARIGITITYKTAGTAKVRGSHIRHTFCGLGCGLEIRERNCDNHATAPTVNPSTTITSPGKTGADPSQRVTAQVNPAMIEL